jgi:hypothetical protein
MQDGLSNRTLVMFPGRRLFDFCRSSLSLGIEKIRKA